MVLNIRQLLCGEPMRLRYVNRFATCRVLHSETVAEHSYYTTLYSMMIADSLIEEGTLHIATFDYRTLLSKALLHDMEEARTGDVPRHQKYSSLEFAKLWEESTRQAFIGVIEPVVNRRLLKDYCFFWEKAKDNTTITGKIVAFADFLSVLSYVAEEMASSNTTILPSLESLSAYAQIFESTDYDFVRDYVNQAREFVEEVLDGRIEL